MHFGEFISEAAGIVTEHLGLFSEKLWQDSDLQVVLRMKREMGPINENRFFA